MPTVCDVLINRLSDAGVKHIFGVPGDAINALLEAIRLQNDVDFIHVNHEESGAFAASAQAKLTGNLAVCAGTAGPGAIHLLNGLYDAKCDHAPVLAITGQVETKYLGSDYQQEIDLLNLFSDVAVFNEMIVNPAQMPYLIVRAIQTAIEKKGIAHLNIPVDVASMHVPDAKKWPLRLASPVRQSLDMSAIDEAVDLLNAATRPVILAGIGCKGANDKIFEIAKRISAPIVHALRAKELFPDSHPLSAGGLGNLGVTPAVQAMRNCDLLLMAGTDFPYVEYLPEKVKTIQIDIDANQIGKRVPVDVGIAGDVASVSEQLLPRLKKSSQIRFLAHVQSSMQKWKEDTARNIMENDRLIKPQRLAHLIGEVADESTIFVCDTGEVTFWTARYLQMRFGQRFTVSGMLASMAFGLPGAIGAKLAYPNRSVVALVGDGGFSMLMTDFLTAVRYELPIAVVVFNNRRLGMIQIEQEARGYPNYETDMFNPDFAEFAKVCGGDGISVTDPNQLESALHQAMESKVPFIVDAHIDADELPVPPRVTARQAANYGIARTKELLG